MQLIGRIGELACWSVVVVVWLAGAVYNAGRAPVVAARGGLAGAWLFGVGACLLGWPLVPTPVWHAVQVRQSWTVAVGLVVLVLGAALAVWARVTLGTMWTSSAVVKRDHHLCTDGPYRITRHPIYTGMLAMVVGTAVIEGLGHWLVMAVAATMLLLGKVRSEERLLDRELGVAYQDYRGRVPALVPRPRRRR